MTQTHALFLEWCCLQAARTAGRYADQNGNSGSKPHTPAPLEADCLEIFETGSALLATLGYPLFDPVGVSGTSPTEEDVFTLRDPLIFPYEINKTKPFFNGRLALEKFARWRALN